MFFIALLCYIEERVTDPRYNNREIVKRAAFVPEHIFRVGEHFRDATNDCQYPCGFKERQDVKMSMPFRIDTFFGKK